MSNSLPEKEKHTKAKKICLIGVIIGAIVQTCIALSPFFGVYIWDSTKIITLTNAYASGVLLTVTMMVAWFLVYKILRDD